MPRVETGNGDEDNGDLIRRYDVVEAEMLANLEAVGNGEVSAVKERAPDVLHRPSDPFMFSNPSYYGDLNDPVTVIDQYDVSKEFTDWFNNLTPWQRREWLRRRKARRLQGAQP